MVQRTSSVSLRSIVTENRLPNGKTQFLLGRNLVGVVFYTSARPRDDKNVYRAVFYLPERPVVEHFSSEAEACSFVDRKIASWLDDCSID